MLYKRKPFLCFIGPVAGRNKQIIPTPGEFLAYHFREAGNQTTLSSDAQNKYVRLLDICHTIIRYRTKIDLLILSVYVGQSFVVEDIASWLARHFHIPTIMVLHNGLTPTFVSLFPR